MYLSGSGGHAFADLRRHGFRQDYLLQAANGMLEDFLVSANVVSELDWHVCTQRQKSGNAASLHIVEQ